MDDLTWPVTLIGVALLLALGSVPLAIIDLRSHRPRPAAQGTINWPPTYAETVAVVLAEIVAASPADVIVRRDEISPGRAYVLSGAMFTDGHERTVINTDQALREGTP